MQQPSMARRRLKLIAVTAVIFWAGGSALESETQLSSCAISCLTTEFPQSGCSSPDDTNCVCASKTYETAVGACLQRSCTVREALATQKYNTYRCDLPIRNEGGTLRGVSWALFAFALFFVLGRFLFRKGSSGYGGDDWAVLFGLGTLLPIDILVDRMVSEGLGQDVWMIPFNSITNILRDFWVAEVLYVWLMGATKISVLFLYLRIWQPPETGYSRLRVASWSLIATCVVFVVVYTITLAMACEPITYTWERWDQPKEGKCFNVNDHLYSLAGVNIVLDFFICFLPVPNCMQLSMSLWRRVGISIMFLFGLFVTICSIIRFKYLVTFGNTTNPTWDYNPIALWSSAECNLSVICVCLPAMAGLFQRAYKKGMSSFGSYRDGSTPRSRPRIVRMDGQDERSASRTGMTDDVGHIELSDHYGMPSKDRPVVNERTVSQHLRARSQDIECL